MDNIEASRILRAQRVDSSFDTRPPLEILTTLVDEGHLPGELLRREVQVQPIATDIRELEV